VGATCNPSIAVSVLKKEMASWKVRIKALAESYPQATEDEISWKIVEEMSANGAKLLKPIFDRRKGPSMAGFPFRRIREPIAIPTRFWRRQSGSASLPEYDCQDCGHARGIVAIEEATYRGVSINATASFTLPQAVAVAKPWSAPQAQGS